MTTTTNNEHKKLNVPNLRFKEFQGEWEKNKLCDVSTIVGRIGFRGYTTQDIVDEGKGAIALSPTNIVNNKLTYEKDNTYISFHKFEESPEIMINQGDVIFVKTGSTVGKVAYVGELICKTTLNPQVVVLKNILCDNYLLSVIMSTQKFQNKIRKITVGGAVPTLSQVAMGKIFISLPKVEEQAKLSKFIALFDERIATQNKIIEDLKKLKCAIIEQLLNCRESKKVCLGDIGSFVRGLTYSINDVVEENGTLVMRSNNIVNGSPLDYKKNVVYVNKQISSEQLLQSGDVVICMANGSSSLVGKSSYYDGGCLLPITVGAFCGIYRSNEPLVKWLFQTSVYRRYIWKSLQGGNGAIANLNSEDILRMSFNIPEASTKKRFVKLLTSTDSTIKNNTRLYDLYILQKQYLLRQMFI